MEDNATPLSQAKVQIGSRSGTWIFLISLVDSGPPWYVVTQESGPSDPELCKRIIRFVNMDHYDEIKQYVPHLAFKMAKRVAEHFRGRVIWFDRSESEVSPENSRFIM